MASAHEIKRAKNKQFYFNLKATNGEIILTSEMYKSRTGARNGIKSVQKNGPDCLRYDMKMDKRGQYYFLLMVPNRKVIGKSESYTTAAKMEKGIMAVMKCSGAPAVHDLTQ